MKPLSSGDLNQRVTIQRPPAAGTVDALGQRVESWSPVSTVWAQVVPRRGREIFAAGAQQSEADVMFRIRFRAGVDSTMRVVWRDKPYALIADPIDVDGGRHTLELVCIGGGRDT